MIQNKVPLKTEDIDKARALFNSLMSFSLKQPPKERPTDILHGNEYSDDYDDDYEEDEEDDW